VNARYLLPGIAAFLLLIGIHSLFADCIPRIDWIDVAIAVSGMGHLVSGGACLSALTLCQMWLAFWMGCAG